jgi:hypothetical protein
MAGNEQVRFRNPIDAVGFAQIYSVMAVDPMLSDGAVRTFMLYQQFAQGKAHHWYSREKLARIRGVSPWTISQHNMQLQQAGYIEREERFGQTSITWLLDIHQNERLAQLAADMLELRDGPNEEETDRTAVRSWENPTPNVVKTQHSMLGKPNAEVDSTEVDSTKETQILSGLPPADDEPERVQLDDDGNEVRPKGARAREKSEIPDTVAEQELLAVCGRRYYQKGEKRKTKQILKALEAGDIAQGTGKNVFLETLDWLEHSGDEITLIPLLPRAWFNAIRTWVGYKKTRGRVMIKYPEFLAALTNWDRLNGFCRDQLRTNGGANVGNQGPEGAAAAGGEGEQERFIRYLAELGMDVS